MKNHFRAGNSANNVSVAPTATKSTIEILVQDRFSDLEVASIVTTLQQANNVASNAEFFWKFISDKPGLVHGKAGLIVRAEPLVFDHNLPDQLLIVGGDKIEITGWVKRFRAMRRSGKTSILLSDAATAFIKSLKSSEIRLTTHWKDRAALSELGHFPALGTSFAEISGNLLTSAGASYTTDLLLNLIAHSLTPRELAELSSLLLVKTIRNAQEDQPSGACEVTNALPPSVARAIKQMDENISEPLTISEIAKKSGISVRQLERKFSEYCGLSPGRIYKKTRVKKAHALVVGTNLSLADIAVATGFGSTSSLSVAFMAEYGQRPTTCRP